MAEAIERTPDGWTDGHRWINRRIGHLTLRVSTCGSVWDWQVDNHCGDRLFTVYGQAETMEQAAKQAEHMAAFWQPAADHGGAAREVQWRPDTAAYGCGVTADVGDHRVAVRELRNHTFEYPVWFWYVWRGGVWVASGQTRTFEKAERMAEMVLRGELA